jgi:metal-dependent HD superfamily phosphatase/phosphodiesterase
VHKNVRTHEQPPPAVFPPQEDREFRPVTLDEVRANPYIVAYIRRADEQMGILGYTEHGDRHATLTANIARNILLRLGYPERTAELAAISGYLHDVGNLLHRGNHALSGAIIAMEELRRMGMRPEEIAIVMGAIGNHEEDMGDPVGEVSAAVIIADKSDVHRSRVRNPNTLAFDIHDRVNYAAQRSFVRVDGERKTITLEVDIDTNISQVMEYFEIFMSRMLISRRAATYLGCTFELVINKVKLL